MTHRIDRRDCLGLAAGAVASIGLGHFGEAADDGSGALRSMLRIQWRTGPDLPQGFQDSDGGFIGDALVSVGGFCSGGLEEDRRRKPGKYPRGFLKKGWWLDLSADTREWQPLPDFPGAARQGLAAARVGDSLCYWGGFSYDAPYTYDDGWRLRRGRAGEWSWEALPAFPWRMTTPALAVLGTNIYALGGADYDATAFYTATDRAGKTKRFGARFHRLDTTRLEDGWRELPPCPGTPRWVHAPAVVGERLFFFGGASGDTTIDGVRYGYCSIVDNWSFDPAAQKWTRLADLPIGSGNFPKSSNLVYDDRYVILPGGHQYPHVLNPDGTARPTFGRASQANPASGLHNDVFVYDAQKNEFGAADKLPIDNNLPMTVVRGDEIYLLGGETGGGLVEGKYYGHHPDLLLVGKITPAG